MQQGLDFEVQPWRNIQVAQRYVTLTCPHVPTIQVTGGDYFIIKSGTHGDMFIGKVLQIDAAWSTLQVQIYLLAGSITNHQLHIPQLNTATYSFVSGMVEVVATNRLKWVNISTVCDYAFIFHPDSVQSGFYDCHGMENAYFIRFRMFQRRLRQQENQLFTPEITMVANNDFISFSHLSDSSFFESSHHRAYQVLSMVKRVMDQLLWTERKYKQGNGVVRSSPIPLSQEGWNYVRFRMAKRGIPIISREVSRAYKAYFPDLTSSMTSLETTLHSMEASSTEELRTVRSIFGSGVGFGCRRPKPRKKDGLCRLQAHEQVNVIEFTYNHDIPPPPEDPDESPPIPNSVIFLYDEKQQLFSVRVYHSYVRVMSSRGQAILNGINHSLGNVREASSIMIGSTFNRDSRYFETISVEQNGTVQCKDMVSNETVTLCSNEVEELINSSN